MSWAGVKMIVGMVKDARRGFVGLIDDSFDWRHAEWEDKTRMYDVERQPRQPFGKGSWGGAWEDGYWNWGLSWIPGREPHMPRLWVWMYPPTG